MKTRLCSFGTWYVYSYLAAIHKAAMPTSCSRVLFTTTLLRYMSIRCVAMNRV